MAESKIRRQAADERFAGDSFDEGDEAAKALQIARPDLAAMFVSNDQPSRL